MTYKDLAPVVKSFMFKNPFFGHLLMKMRKEFSKEVPTAAVAPDMDTYNVRLLINEEFWEGLPKEHQEGILFHETLHVAYGHLQVLDQFNDKMLANIAMDMEINQYIPRTSLPDSCVMYNEDIFADLNLPPKKGTRFYYDALQNEASKNDEFAKMLAELKASGGGSDHGNWKKYDDLSEAQKKMFDNQQKHSLTEAYKDTGTDKQPGNLPGGLAKRIEEMMKKKPEVFNWKAYFRKFVGTVPDISRKKTLKRQSKRFSELPGLRTKRRVKIFVSIDTSGSVGSEDLAELFEQIDYVWRAGAQIDCVTWDTIIHDRFEYDGRLPKTINGGGGSDVGMAIEEFNKKRKDYTCAVHFTDGYINNSTRLTGRHLFVITSSGTKDLDTNGKATVMQIPHKDLED